MTRSIRLKRSFAGELWCEPRSADPFDWPVEICPNELAALFVIPAKVKVIYLCTSRTAVRGACRVIPHSTNRAAIDGRHVCLFISLYDWLKARTNDDGLLWAWIEY